MTNCLYCGRYSNGRHETCQGCGAPVPVIRRIDYGQLPFPFNAISASTVASTCCTMAHTNYPHYRNGVWYSTPDDKTHSSPWDFGAAMYS